MSAFQDALVEINSVIAELQRENHPQARRITEAYRTVLYEILETHDTLIKVSHFLGVEAADKLVDILDPPQ